MTSPFPGQVLAAADLNAPYDTERVLDVPQSEANLVTSQIAGSDLHKPVIDIDLPAVLLPSSTPGHHHLFIDKPMSWETYVKLLDAMVEAGLVEPGYVNASVNRGYSSVRLPWVRKS